MDWAGWAIFGLIATALLTAVMLGAQLAGLTRLDLPLLLGTTVVADPDQARVAGFFIHLVNGQLFALGYALVFAVHDAATVPARLRIFSIEIEATAPADRRGGDACGCAYRDRRRASLSPR